MTKHPSANSVVKVGDGRGFVIKHRAKVARPKGLPKIFKLVPFTEYQCIITAAHCLRKLPLPIALRDTPSRTYQNLIGSLDGATSNVPAECIFVDSVADIAVLGCPDDQALPDEAEAYHSFIDNLPVLRIDSASSGTGWMLSLGGHWVAITLNVRPGRFGRVGLEIDPTEAGQSGSPILNAAGRAVGAVAIGSGDLNLTTGKHTNERCGPQPILTRNLPAWMVST